MADLAGGVDNPHEDAWHLGRHIARAQEAMDPPGVEPSRGTEGRIKMVKKSSDVVY